MRVMIGIVRKAFVVSLVMAAMAAWPAIGSAQQTGGSIVTGRVLTAERGEALSGAHVAVRSAADSSVVTGTLSNASGAFLIRRVPAGRYYVEASYVGYGSARSDAFTLAASDTVSVGDLRLDISAVELESIRVRTERAPAVFAADRTIYSTDDMPVASGGGATEVLRSIPELQVDIDGAVTLRGSTPDIYINGRPAPMEGEALNIFLEQFPADRIERVEVIPNPSARFDAEGAGGIVNIVLKEDVELGLSGSVFANVGSRGEVGGGGRLAYQRGPWTLFGGGYLRHSSRESSSWDERQNLLADPTTYLRQDAWSERGGLSGSLDLSVERELSEGSILWVEGRFHDWGNDSEALTATAHLDAQRDTTQFYNRVSDSDSERLSGDVALGYTRQWQPQRHELEIELELESGRDDELERVETEVLELAEGADLIPAELTIEDSGQRERQAALEADYVRPWGEEGRLELGYEAELQDQADDRLLSQIEDPDGARTVDETLTGFEYREIFNSVYLTALRRWGDLGIQLGARLERADTRFELPDGDTFENSYTSLFPSANISYDFDRGRQLRLSYSRRVRRPSPWVMNPIDRSTDPLNHRVGNPYIEPQYVHSVSLDASWTASMGTLRLSPYYRQVENDWTEIKTVDAEGVSTVTWENVASQEQYGASLTASVRPLDGWSGFASISAHQEIRDASNLAPEYSGESFQWSTHANLNARITPSLSVQVMGAYFPARELPQGEISSRVMTHMGVRQQFWDDRASLRLALVDPFDLFDSTFQTRDPSHIQVGRSDFSIRSVRISFSYAFGADPDSVRDQSEGPVDETPEAGIR